MSRSGTEGEAIRQACIEAALRAYEEGGIRGLCAEGRWEYAVQAMRAVEVHAREEPPRRALDPACRPRVHPVNTVNTILYCRKWEETVAFYETILDLRRLFSNDWFVEFELSGTARVSVADAARASIDSSEGQGITLSLEVEDVAATHARLSEAGVTPSPIRKLWGQRVTYLRDPEGTRLEFWSRPPTQT